MKKVTEPLQEIETLRLKNLILEGEKLKLQESLLKQEIQNEIHKIKVRLGLAENILVSISPDLSIAEFEEAEE